MKPLVDAADTKIGKRELGCPKAYGLVGETEDSKEGPYWG